MALRQREWARKKRLELRCLLGLKCKHCGSKDYRTLEFDLIVLTDKKDKNGITFHHKSMEWSWRMSFYRQQLNMKNLQLLCSKYNSAKGNKIEDINPF